MTKNKLEEVYLPEDAVGELSKIMREMREVAETEIAKIKAGRAELDKERQAMREDLMHLLAFTGHARQFLFDLMEQFEVPDGIESITDPLRPMFPKKGPSVMDYAEMNNAFDKMRGRELEIADRIMGLKDA